MTNGQNGLKVDEKGTIQKELMKTGGKRIVVDFRDEMNVEWPKNWKGQELEVENSKIVLNCCQKHLKLNFPLTCAGMRLKMD